ncbi:MAG: YbfB/YjiJ family MFS transporter [Formosimonas sp.]
MNTIKPQRFWMAGLAATFIGNGIGRFGYITLIPVLIQANWFSKAEASQLGVATLLGYLLGPPMIQRLEYRVRAVTLVKWGMVLCSLSYLACSIQTMGFAWFYVWRLLAGLGGAMLMVLAAPMILPYAPVSARGKTSGLIFSGIGLGAALSGVMIPIVVTFSVGLAWLSMGWVCALFMLLSWGQWSKMSMPVKNSVACVSSAASRLGRNTSIMALLLAYALNAIGFLPHTLFWVDFMVRELGFSLTMGGISWALFGLGAAIGPLLTGILGDAIGLRKSLLICFFLKACAVALPLVGGALWLMCVSAFCVGLFTPGIVTLASTYALQLIGQQQHQRVWGRMTFVFALMQALGGFVMAGFVSTVDSYLPLFLVSSGALLLSVALIAYTRNGVEHLKLTSGETSETVLE